MATMVMFMAYYQDFSLSKGARPHVTTGGCTVVRTQRALRVRAAGSENGRAVAGGYSWWPAWGVLNYK